MSVRHSLRYFLLFAGPLAIGMTLAWLARLTGMAASDGWFAIFLATAASCCSALFFASRKTEGGAEAFARKIEGEIDHIMIGAAETSYFVDNVKKKIESDVLTIKDIVGSSQHNADTTQHIATNAERASKIAAEVRKEAVAARGEVDRGLQQILGARQEASNSSTMMGALQEKSRRIHGMPSGEIASAEGRNSAWRET